MQMNELKQQVDKLNIQITAMRPISECNELRKNLEEVLQKIETLETDKQELHKILDMSNQTNTGNQQKIEIISTKYLGFLRSLRKELEDFKTTALNEI